MEISMKGLDNTLRLLAVALIAAVALAAFMAARTTAREYYAYQAQIAPRTLHQMVMEMEAADEPERGNSLFWGGALALAAVAVFGGMIFAMHGGTDLLRERRLGRRKARRPSGRDGYPRVASRAPSAPYLPEPDDVRYLPEGNHNYANDNNRNR